MNRCLRTLLVQLGLVVSGAAVAAPVGCLIEAERVVDVGAPVVGIISAVRVDRGDMVREGQTLATLEAEVERANLGVAEARSRLDADVRAAEANLELTRQRLVRAEQLQAKNFVSPQAVDQARAEHEVAGQKLNQTREQKDLWRREFGVAKAQVGLRTIRSPFDGIVIERLMDPGVRVEEKPILRLAKVDPLRVELILPAADYGTVAAGAMLTVRPELPNAMPLTARVIRVDKVIDAASNTFRVRMTLPNPGNSIPAGLRCKLDAGAGTRSARAGGDDPPLLLRRANALARR